MGNHDLVGGGKLFTGQMTVTYTFSWCRNIVTVLQRKKHLKRPWNESLF
jgi:hypothetical protein